MAVPDSEGFDASTEARPWLYSSGVSVETDRNTAFQTMRLHESEREKNSFPLLDDFGFAKALPIESRIVVYVCKRHTGQSFCCNRFKFYTYVYRCNTCMHVTLQLLVCI